MRLASRGFTLVELLIVMAIIAILTSVVFPRLQSARDEGVETKIKTELTVVGKRASIEENQSFTFDVVCGTNGFAQAPSIADQISSVEEFSGQTVTCNGTTDQYAISIFLSSSTYWCVDSQGKRLNRTTDLAVGEYVCE